MMNQKMVNREISKECLKCDYPLTEPICACCLINETKAWLHEQDLDFYLLEKINTHLETFSREIASLDHITFSKDSYAFSELECIKCQKPMGSMCNYCATRNISQIVNFSLKNKNSKENFREIFNTELYDFVAMNFL